MHVKLIFANVFVFLFIGLLTLIARLIGLQELQTFTDPCCYSTSPAVQQLPMNDVCCRVLQRGDFVRKSQAGYSHLVGGSAWQ
jgi:hypothetical protein